MKTSSGSVSKFVLYVSSGRLVDKAEILIHLKLLENLKIILLLSVGDVAQLIEASSLMLKV